MLKGIVLCNHNILNKCIVDIITTPYSTAGLKISKILP